MSSLNIAVTSASAVSFAAVPTIAFRLTIANRIPHQEIESISLRCQIMIEASRRQYSPDERARLSDLFGETERWAKTLRSVLWTHAAVHVHGFTGTTIADLHVPCTFDFNVGATKYFHAVEQTDIPLCFQFSGSVFYNAGGILQIDPIAWEQEARFRLPASVWQNMMHEYYPNGAWLRLRQDVFDRLNAYKTEHGLMTWDDTIDSLLNIGKPLPLTRKAAP